MNSKRITELLYNKFQDHKYKLSNSFIYNWESDFFSVFASGYVQEIEVKVSYSDFKADFNKISKHNLLSAIYNNKNKYLDVGQLVYELTPPIKKTRRGSVKVESYISKQSNKSCESLFKKKKYNFKQISTEIKFQDIRKAPNKFWYICPKDVIPLEEVPEYAGLYYVYDSGRIYCKKKAPFLHKEKQDLNKVLLDKFYYLSLSLESKLKQC